MRSDGKKWLVIKATKDELSAAPSFDRSSLFSEGVADPAAAVKEANPEMPASTPPAAPQTNTTP
ncbi:hypothetical protein [Pseudochrobactrum kiredjianiae]|uniref:Uncharacterized protein n=1 Tax=Pseudochrobactrum kiredjianiae TaxID=386305 RepID=A0ABW3UZW8_9HYPH|nr:hypothetical protein [Pseudochrobactrum kiredjianiae]MDM7852489.1 hypothetical protein [Pseudochrobactrum kiredjianiae]